MKNNKKQINIRLTPATYQLLELLSDYQTLTKTDIIEFAIHEYAQEHLSAYEEHMINIYKTQIQKEVKK